MTGAHPAFAGSGTKSERHPASMESTTAFSAGSIGISQRNFTPTYTSM